MGESLLLGGALLLHDWPSPLPVDTRQNLYEQRQRGNHKQREDRDARHVKSHRQNNSLNAR
jgi:hypothetical protein